ncbi:cyclic nucleotide-binding/CBS domain-containing protein [Halorientalis sp.]|jgi:signal-transduction protein with cAMP-binding, CBS, and nucleotidyltransferase domain|uniref:CBS domain-containing protein n=1 Tax=Halorientalis sp. TaxID=1931229 RepID=UPI002606E010|nr:CBS domain-containing protein [Halorientalis sp.]
MADETPVSEIMSAPVKTVGKNATVEEVARVFAEEGVGSLIIGEDPVDGIITEYDVVESIGQGENPAETTVGQLMSEPVVTIRPGDTVENAGDRMGNNGVKKLPVTEDGKPTGIVTTTDLAHFLPHHRLEMASQTEEDVPDGEFE